MTGVAEKSGNIAEAANRKIRFDNVVAVQVKIVDIVVGVNNEAGRADEQKVNPDGQASKCGEMKEPH